MENGMTDDKILGLVLHSLDLVARKEAGFAHDDKITLVDLDGYHGISIEHANGTTNWHEDERGTETTYVVLRTAAHHRELKRTET